MSDSKTISLDAFRKKKQKEEAEKPYLGTLVWLYCRVCETIEYTEVVAPHGRTHKCGTIVEEVEVPLDLRAEYTLTQFNLEKINGLLHKNKESRLRKLISKSLDNALMALKQSEENYISRLHLAAGCQIPVYPGSLKDLEKQLPIKEINKLGMLISDFRFEPEKRFLKNKKQ
ncbi:hypothetical protein KJ966_16685 [bacterium]|nr:hypothetical protein [bacterium]